MTKQNPHTIFKGRTLAQIIEQMRREYLPLQGSPIFELLSNKSNSDLNAKALQVLTKALDSMGFRRFEYLGNGAHAIAMKTTENQIVRISVRSDEEPRPYHPAVLQPILSKTVNIPHRYSSLSILIEVLPKVKTEGVTTEHIDTLRKALEASGLWVSDIIKHGNVGLMEVGGKEIPILIDSGQVFLDETRKEPETTDHLNPWLADDGVTWVQHIFESRQQPSGVVNDKDLERLETRMRGKRKIGERVVGWLKNESRDSRRESQTAKAMREDRLYAREVGALHDLARAKFDEEKNPGVSYSDVIKEERALLKQSKDLT